MPADVFFDTTVLVYLIASGDPSTQVAEPLLAKGGMISVQVLNEFANVATRKMRLSWQETERALTAIRAFCGPPMSLAVATHDSALHIAKRYRFHIYDSLIIASAIDAGCSVLYSEDMQHGQVINSLTIRNPFLSH